MKECQYLGCKKEATKKLTISQLEITEGSGAGVGYFCEEHADRMIDCSADNVEDI